MSWCTVTNWSWWRASCCIGSLWIGIDGNCKLLIIIIDGYNDNGYINLITIIIIIIKSINYYINLYYYNIDGTNIYIIIYNGC